MVEEVGRRGAKLMMPIGVNKTGSGKWKIGKPFDFVFWICLIDLLKDLNFTEKLCYLGNPQNKKCIFIEVLFGLELLIIINGL